MSTLFCEVEGIFNNRPLTPVSCDPNDMVPLTPNHLLLLAPGSGLPPGRFTEADNYCRRRWKQMQCLADVFWQRWRKRYLRTLQERQKWFREGEPFRLGDLVLVVDFLLPQNQRCVGRILAIYKSDDGRIRSARVKISKCISGRNLDVSISEINRPILKLIKLMST